MVTFIPLGLFFLGFQNSMAMFPVLQDILSNLHSKHNRELRFSIEKSYPGVLFGDFLHNQPAFSKSFIDEFSARFPVFLSFLNPI